MTSLAADFASTEEVALFNPAFLAVLLHASTRDYEKVAGDGMPFILPYLILPLTLHKPTRQDLPTTAAAQMQKWIRENPRHLVNLDQRTVGLRPFVSAAMRLALIHRVVHSEGGLLKAGTLKRRRKGAARTESEEVESCYDAGAPSRPLVRPTAGHGHAAGDLGSTAMIQIEKLVLYPRLAFEPREVDFTLGELNVITGASGTGKSSLIHIFRYCLGSSRPGVPLGAVSRSVAWYVMIIRVGPRRFLLGRPAPSESGAEVTAALLMVEPDGLPAQSQLVSNTTAEELRAYLGTAIGIEENLNVPGQGQTRRALTASFVHTLYYCFQGQGEIANPEVLFHRQNREWQPQTIRDTLPYFLGAQGSADLRKRQELAEVRRQLKLAEQRLAQVEAEHVDVEGRSEALVVEAIDVRLLEPLTQEDRSLSVVEAQALLRSVIAQPVVPAGADQVGAGFEELRLELADQKARAREVADQLRGLERFGQAASNYASELEEQQSRLATIGLIPEAAGRAECPLCGNQIEDEEASERASVAIELQGASRRLELAHRDTPRIEKARAELLDERRQVLDRIDEVNAALNALAETNELAARERQRVNLQSYVRGKVAQFLEATPYVAPAETDRLRRGVAQLEEKALALAQELDPASLRYRVESALARVNRHLTEYAKSLGLEHADHGVRLDLNRLTVVADTLEGPAFLDAGQIGSGLNWVGYHLSTYLALHKFFIENGRPVPRFILIDQPSQAFFPRDRQTGGDLDELTDTDREDTKRLYRLMYDAVEAHQGALQIIALDHADFEESWFQDSVRQRWRDDALIPQEWLDALAAEEASESAERANGDGETS